VNMALALDRLKLSAPKEGKVSSTFWKIPWYTRYGIVDIFRKFKSISYAVHSSH